MDSSEGRLAPPAIAANTSPFAPAVRRPLLLGLVGLAAVFFGVPGRSNWMAGGGFVLYTGVVIYFGAQTIGRFVRGQVRAGFYALVRFIPMFLLLLPVAFLLFMFATVGPAYDGFAKGLAIPAGIEISEPIAASQEVGSSPRNGKGELTLYRGSQPGNYQARAWINPGEPGVACLRAYEVTRNTRLSQRDLDNTSSKRLDWSGNRDEVFVSHCEITIFEGDWGQPYAARFELWFKPDAGGAERKLIQRNFKIEGWQR